MVSLWENWRGGMRRGPRFDTVGGSSTYATELTRRHPTVSLTRQGADSGHLQINLSWRARTSDLNGRPRRGRLPRNPLELFKPVPVQGHTQGVVTVDLDLACLYELTDGSKGVVQPLGGLLGEINAPPYVKLSGDDRFGGTSGETIYVNLDHKDKIKRLLVFVYIYDGTPAFDRTQAVVTLIPSSGPRIEVGLDEREPDARSCAVVLIERDGKGQLVVRREVRYVYGFQSELDRLYGWGLQWGRGFKKSGRS
ncbi:Tellurium resistance [Streptomyces sp. TRM 70361]|uniref:Tellurium resistance n=1 Tax=Streptomyces sp. TRM 70361 TaxID=3116553 RepID=UPI002E7BD943|nr:Tellurium resistance [Streptomyces sp. TRM 70361]MEE1939766.1 Tellurium resistance [Streptomyces sp. TRM 70361]